MPLELLVATSRLSCWRAVAAGFFVAHPAGADSDPLPSWNDGPAKNAILNFVRATTDTTSTKFVQPAERIACFDQDGTLWVEHPVYTQILYCLDRVPAVVKAKPRSLRLSPSRRCSRAIARRSAGFRSRT